MAERIINEMSDSFTLEGMESSVSPRIGISLHPENGVIYQEIINSADKAMYLAKLKANLVTLYCIY